MQLWEKYSKRLSERSEMSTITCLAAVAWEAKKPMVVQEIEVAPPKRGEVRVKILATAVCHTDVYTWNGLDPEGAFPVIFGHEGCGAVESVGEGVTSVAPGDIVIPLFTAECGKCDYCLSGKSNLCGAIRDYSSKGVMSDGTVRFTSKGKPIYHYMGTSTFTEYTVIHEISCCKITSSVPFDKLCLFGCGIPTGVGAVLNTSKVEPGSTVAVFGCGAIGLSAIQGAKMAGASQIIAVDINPEKFEISKSFGATSCVNPDDHKQSISDVLVEMTGGLDYTFECTGKTEVMNSALAAAHKVNSKQLRTTAHSKNLLSSVPFQNLFLTFYHVDANVYR